VPRGSPTTRPVLTFAVTLPAGQSCSDVDATVQGRRRHVFIPCAVKPKNLFFERNGTAIARSTRGDRRLAPAERKASPIDARGTVGRDVFKVTRFLPLLDAEPGAGADAGGGPAEDAGSCASVAESDASCFASWFPS
jgi:hypothetical protein